VRSYCNVSLDKFRERPFEIVERFRAMSAGALGYLLRIRNEMCSAWAKLISVDRENVSGGEGFMC
jgi:hypothetical protein